MLLTGLKFICLFFAVKYTWVNIFRFLRGQNIPSANSSVQAIGITGFIFLQWLI